MYMIICRAASQGPCSDFHLVAGRMRAVNSTSAVPRSLAIQPRAGSDPSWVMLERGQICPEGPLRCAWQPGTVTLRLKKRETTVTSLIAAASTFRSHAWNEASKSLFCLSNWTANLYSEP